MSEQSAELKKKEEHLKLQAKIIADKEQIIVDKERTLKTKSNKITTLEEYIRYMTQQRFGASSEKCSPDQLGLFDEAELLSDSDDIEEFVTQVPAHSRQKKRVSIPENLPTTDIIHDLPEDEKFCPHDNTPLRHFADECHKQLDYIPAKITVLNHIRHKYMCPCCQDYLLTAKNLHNRSKSQLLAQGYYHKLLRINIVMLYRFIVNVKPYLNV